MCIRDSNDAMFKTTAEKRRAAIARPAGKNLCREAGCRPRRALRGGTMQSAANGVLDAHERLLIDQAIKEDVYKRQH